MANITGYDPTNVRALGNAVTRHFDMGEAGASLGMVCQIVADGTLEMANATTAGGIQGQLVMLVAGGKHTSAGTVVDGERVTAVLIGAVFMGEDAALDETKTYYVSATDGVLTDVAPANSRRVGHALSSTVLFFDPSVSVPGTGS